MRFALAGLLGLLVPGAGHMYIGRRRVGAFFLLPVVVLLLGVAAVYADGGLTALLVIIVTPGVLVGLAWLNVALGAWRMAASLDAARRAPRSRVATGFLAAALVGLVVIPHVFVGRIIASTDDFLNSMFASGSAPSDDPSSPLETEAPWFGFTWDPRRQAEGGFREEPLPSAAPLPSAQPTPGPTRAPLGPYGGGGGAGTLPPLGAAVPWEAPGAIPWGNDGRFDFLLMGSDAGPGRWSRRVDVMLLVEIDVATGKVAMIGLPRNLQNAPYPPGPARDYSSCGCQPGLLNEMYVEATARHPDRWPGTGAIKGIGAVRSVVSELTGRPVDAVLIVDLLGVVRVIDAMGGVDINVPARVIDTYYPDPFYGNIYLRIDAGQQHMDGRIALAYARSRHSSSDPARMSRQQTLLLAIRDALGVETIFNAPALFDAARSTAWTDLPRDSLPALVELFGRAQTAAVTQLRIVPNTYPAWLTASEIARIRADIAGLLGPVPAPTPTPAPSPTPSPTDSPTPEPSPTSTPDPSPTTTGAPSPTPAPTPGPTPEPSPTESSSPTPEPTPSPTASP